MLIAEERWINRKYIKHKYPDYLETYDEHFERELIKPFLERRWHGKRGRLSCTVKTGRFAVGIYHPLGSLTNLLQNQAWGDHAGRGRGLIWAVGAALLTNVAPTAAATAALTAFSTTLFSFATITTARIIFVSSVGQGLAGVFLLVVRIASDLLVYVEEDTEGSISSDQRRVNRVSEEAEFNGLAGYALP